MHNLRRRNAHRHPHHTSRLRSRFPLRRSCLVPTPPISRSESTREQQHPLSLLVTLLTHVAAVQGTARLALVARLIPAR